MTQSDLDLNPPFVSITVKDEQKIAEMIRAFQQCRADVLRVEVVEPSLEDIFLDK